MKFKPMQVHSPEPLRPDDRHLAQLQDKSNR